MFFRDASTNDTLPGIGVLYIKVNILEKINISLFFNTFHIYIYVYIYIYIYYTISDVYTTALLLTKLSSDDDSWFRHGFRAEASLPLAQSAPAVSHNTTRLCQIVVTLWDCHIHADAVWALSWIFSMYFLLSDGGSPRLFKKTEVELAIKPLHPTSIYIYIYIYIYILFLTKLKSK